MLHLLLLITAFVLLSVPLRHLTGAVKSESGQAVTGASGVVEGMEEHPEGEHVHRVPVRIRVRYAHAPEMIRLEVGKRDLLKGVSLGTSPVECEAELEIGHEGNEFVLEVKWPEGVGATAVTVELEPEGLDMRSETRWSEGGAVSDVLTFVW
ncbi:MAG: hypothetical protein QE274_05045 [Verrucomicrobiaceae bacterium]|nr:hypothetical protein [Verrucomicrobiaceae bacterium]